MNIGERLHSLHMKNLHFKTWNDCKTRCNFLISYCKLQASNSSVVGDTMILSSSCSIENLKGTIAIDFEQQ